jgi:hypothetical protein
MRPRVKINRTPSFVVRLGREGRKRGLVWLPLLTNSEADGVLVYAG